MVADPAAANGGPPVSSERQNAMRVMKTGETPPLLLPLLLLLRFSGYHLRYRSVSGICCLGGRGNSLVAVAP